MLPKISIPSSSAGGRALPRCRGRVLPPPSSARGWRAYAPAHALIAAPTGRARARAFLFDRRPAARESRRDLAGPQAARRGAVIYVSPLKALSADIHKNLAEPTEIERIREMGLPPVRVTAVRSGDTLKASGGDAAHARTSW